MVLCIQALYVRLIMSIVISPLGRIVGPMYGFVVTNPRLVQVNQGSIFFNWHISPGRMLMIAFCFAHDLTYEENQRYTTYICTGDDLSINKQTRANNFSMFRSRLINAYHYVNQEQ